jgi:hypothetical protein
MTITATIRITKAATNTIFAGRTKRGIHVTSSVNCQSNEERGCFDSLEYKGWTGMFLGTSKFFGLMNGRRHHLFL